MNAAQEGFNMEYNFSMALSSFAMVSHARFPDVCRTQRHSFQLSRGNALENLVSIGRESPEVPPLPGNIDGTPGGLGKHGRFEGAPVGSRCIADH